MCVIFNVNIIKSAVSLFMCYTVQLWRLDCAVTANEGTFCLTEICCLCRMAEGASCLLLTHLMGVKFPTDMPPRMTIRWPICRTCWEWQTLQWVKVPPRQRPPKVLRSPRIAGSLTATLT